MYNKKIKILFITFIIYIFVTNVIFEIIKNNDLNSKAVFYKIHFTILLVYIILGIYLIIKHSKEEAEIYKKSKENELVATLAAAVMRSDGVVSDKEKNIFFNYIKHKYNDKNREKEIINILYEKLKNPVKIVDICLESKEYVHYNRRFSICRAMFRIASIEDGICEHEKKLLEKTMNLLSLSKVDKEHLRNEFGFNHRFKEKEKKPIDKNISASLKIFGLGNKTTKEDIKKKYKELCFEHHPDRYENCDEMTKNYHNDMMKSINEAYDILLKNY